MKRIFLLLTLAAALVSCSKEQNEIYKDLDENRSTGRIFASANDFVYGGDTRTEITQEGECPPEFHWKEGDEIGVIPVDGYTYQTNHKLDTLPQNELKSKNAVKLDTLKAKFDGGMWEAKEGIEYIAYYPLVESIIRSNDNLTLSFLGQKQTGNNSLKHLGAFDYMYAKATCKHDEKTNYDIINFNFDHLISLVRLTLKLDTPAKEKLASLTLESDEPWFANSASLKLADGETKALELSNTFQLDLDITPDPESTIITVWFAALPRSSKESPELTVKLCGEENFWEGTFEIGYRWNSGEAYLFNADLDLQGSIVPCIDLGLSVKWATCNLGANEPYEYGGYYQWAGTTDVTDTNINLDFDNYPYHDNTLNYNTGWTKYIPANKPSYWSGPGDPDALTSLTPDDDVVNLTYKGKWRIPTKKEWDELKEKCKFTYTFDYKGGRIRGMIVTREGYKDKDGNDIELFLPAAGYRLNNTVRFSHTFGLYWSSTLYDDMPCNAYHLYFESGTPGTVSISSECPRPYGAPLRPVLPKD